MLDTPRSEVVWRVLATHSILQFPFTSPPARRRVPSHFNWTLVMLDTPCSEVVWRVLATHSTRQFPLHFPSRASTCAIKFQRGSTSYQLDISPHGHSNLRCLKLLAVNTCHLTTPATQLISVALVSPNPIQFNFSCNPLHLALEGHVDFLETKACCVATASS